jgi:hypothetical protein
MSVIEVYRGDGLRSGAPIVETLLSDDALLTRGIAEMDRNANAVNQVEIEVVFRRISGGRKHGFHMAKSSAARW